MAVSPSKYRSRSGRGRRNQLSLRYGFVARPSGCRSVDEADPPCLQDSSETVISVAQYYFDISNGSFSSQDDEGEEFDSLEAAIQAAVRSAAEIGADRLAKGDTSDIVVEVRDGKNQRVCTVTASMKIERHGPSL